eukprot:2141949-Prymnesium_polylepis.1
MSSISNLSRSNTSNLARSNTSALSADGSREGEGSRKEGGAGWRGRALSILCDWVEGYNYNVTVRRAHSALEPGWTDLVLWAVLVGEDELARTLWAKSTDALR